MFSEYSVVLICRMRSPEMAWLSGTFVASFGSSLNSAGALASQGNGSMDAPGKLTMPMDDREFRAMPHESDGNPAAAPDQMKLAYERTYLAHERTMMAWTRTTTSLITFGFTLFKFFEFLHSSGQTIQSQHVFGARTFGMIMIGIGVFTLVVACLQHRAQMRRLNEFYPDAPFSLTLLLASLIACLGVLGFLSGIFHP